MPCLLCYHNDCYIEIAGLTLEKSGLLLLTYTGNPVSIIMNYNVDGYSKEEGRAYIEWKLKKAGCTDPVFDDAAIEAILNASDGTARVISKLCNASLVIGHSQSANRITADIVMQAINDSTLG